MECLKQNNWAGAPSAISVNNAVINDNQNDNIEISENRIDSLGYIGVLLGGGEHIVVKNNVIDRAMLSYFDGSAIYVSDDITLTRRITGNVITNILLNVADGHSISAIYLDGVLHPVEVDHNTIINTQYGFHVNYGIGHNFHDNVVFNPQWDFFYSLDFNGGHTENMTISNNRVYIPDYLNAYSPFVYTFYGNPDDNRGATNTINNNYLSRPFSDDNVFSRFYNATYSRAGWMSKSGFDTNSRAEPISYQASGAQTHHDFARIVYNPTTRDSVVRLVANYLDFDGNPVRGTTTLQPFESKILFLNETNDPSTGMEDVELINDRSPRLYPTLFTGTLYLSGAEGSTLQVIATNGAVVHTQKITIATETIHLEHLSSGLYLFRIEKGSKINTLKAIKR
jgi:hypothetical protein